MSAGDTGRSAARWIPLVVFLVMLFGIPHNSPWFGLVLLYLLLGALYVVGAILWVALRSRGAAAALGRTPPVRALLPREKEALDWFGQPERAIWRMPRGNVVDLLAAVRAAGAAPSVHALSGPFVRTASAGVYERRDCIGGVEVLLLPGAEQHLRPGNDADVLLCGRFAVVLALNNTWRIDQARSLPK